jgi:hypothetical protein
VKLWPYDKFHIDTKLSRDELVALFKSQVEARTFFHVYFKENKPFEGKVSQEGFRIKRILSYLNSFQPNVSGKFPTGNTGGQVEVRMTLPPVAIAFLCIWYCVFYYFIRGVCSGLFSGAAQALPALIFSLGMLLPICALVLYSFWSEAIKQKKMIIEILRKGEEIE